jgi:hypothetical protein
MKITEMIKPELIDIIMEEALFDSYDTILTSIKENLSDEQYTPIYSYERDEENERLLEMKTHLENVIEWYVGCKWQTKFKEGCD